jgi:hypothetical protein
MTEAATLGALALLGTLEVFSLGVGVANARRLSNATQAVRTAERAHARAERLEERAGVRPDGGFPMESEPDGDRSAPHHFWVGVIVSVFGFGFMWADHLYPTLGAAFAIGGLAVALDDALEHALPFNSPLNWVWERFLYPVVVARIEGRR